MGIAFLDCHKNTLMSYFTTSMSLGTTSMSYFTTSMSLGTTSMSLFATLMSLGATSMLFGAARMQFGGSFQTQMAPAQLWNARIELDKSTRIQ